MAVVAGDPKETPKGGALQRDRLSRREIRSTNMSWCPSATSAMAWLSGSHGTTPASWFRVPWFKTNGIPFWGKSILVGIGMSTGVWMF